MIKIDGKRFPVKSHEFNGKSIRIRFSDTIDDPSCESDLSIATPSLYCEDFNCRSGNLDGQFFLYVFEHEPVLKHTLMIKDRKLVGSGIATIGGKESYFEIIEPVSLICDVLSELE